MKRIKSRIDPRWDAAAVELPVRFNEVDSMRIVWHGHYIAWCECAREAYLRERGLGYQRMRQLDIAAPIVRLQAEYLSPALGGETVRALVAHVPGTFPRLDLFYEIRGGDGRLLCVAETVQVFIDGAGAVFLTPPPPVEELYAGIRARERAAGIDPEAAP